MNNNVVNQNPYLRTSREFPTDAYLLSVEVNRIYTDISTSINSRIIGIFPTTRSANTGQAWYLKSNKKQEGYRQAYNFTPVAGVLADIALGFKLASIGQITNGWGSYTDGTNVYGLIFASNVAIAGQISFYIVLDGTSTRSDLIRFIQGGGSPVITQGTLVLEWISQP